MKKLSDKTTMNLEYVGFADALTAMMVILFLIIFTLTSSYSKLLSKYFDASGEVNEQKTGKEELVERNRQLEEENQQLLDKIDSLNNNQDTVLFRFNDDNLNNRVLFKSGSDEISEGYKIELENALNVIQGRLNNRTSIKVIGHTDNDPVKEGNTQFKDNWDLGAARANAVVRYFTSTKRTNPITPSKISSTSYGEYHPQNKDSSEKAKAENRRIEIILTTSNQKANE